MKRCHFFTFLTSHISRLRVISSFSFHPHSYSFYLPSHSSTVFPTSPFLAPSDQPHILSKCPEKLQFSSNMKHNVMKITPTRLIWEEEDKLVHIYILFQLCSIPVRNPKSLSLLRVEERVKDTDDQSIHTFITNYSIYVQTVTNLRSCHISLTVPTVNIIYNLQRKRLRRSPVKHRAKPTTNSQTTN